MGAGNLKEKTAPCRPLSRRAGCFVVAPVIFLGGEKLDRVEIFSLLRKLAARFSRWTTETPEVPQSPLGAEIATAKLFTKGAPLPVCKLLLGADPFASYVSPFVGTPRQVPSEQDRGLIERIGAWL